MSCGNIAGTPGSMRSFRSKLLSASYMFGSFTAFPTYNPSELHSEAVMAMGGVRFGYDPHGWPDASRPLSDKRHHIVASHPAACATYFGACIDAVQTVAYGWPVGESKQATTDCLFGQVGTHL